METINGIQPIAGRTFLPKTNTSSGTSFKDILLSGLHQVNSLQKDAEKKASDLVLGDINSFHEVIIATEKASLALQMMVQFQNKAIDAYHEIMRLQL
ncbi:MAG: flagellar hook-basal body complex protein FliE [Syntrophaceticus sp.]